MFDKWMNLPRAWRLGWALALVLFGLAGSWLGGSLVHFSYRGHSLWLCSIAAGVTLLVVDLIFRKNYLEVEPPNVARLDLANHAAAVAPRKLAAVLEALAREFHGDFERQRAALDAGLATLTGAEAREFALAGRLDGAPAAVKLRVRREGSGVLEFRFFAPPEVLARLDEVMGVALG